MKIKTQLPTISKVYFLPAVILTIVLLTSVTFAIARGYNSNDNGIKPGMAVMLTESSGDQNQEVVRASSDSPERFVGVTKTANESAVAIGSKGQQVFVENEGEVQAYVSDVLGDVKENDQLTLSPVAGVLAKAGASTNLIIGTAIEDFDRSKSKEYSIDSPQGRQSVQIATIKINLNPKIVNNSDGIESYLGRLGESIVGKQVSAIRVVVALTIFMVVLLVGGSVLYTATSSALTALGRNPLARAAIRRELAQIVMAAIVVFAVGLSAVYFVLWL